VPLIPSLEPPLCGLKFGHLADSEELKRFVKLN
jgi:hypothetical protein